MPKVPNQDSNSQSSSNVKYFKTRKHALKVVVGNPDPTKGEVAPKTVQFVPYFVYERGKEGKQRYGFLKTANSTVIEKLSGDPDVQQIDQDEYDDATEVVKDESGTQISGYRAPY